MHTSLLHPHIIHTSLPHLTSAVAHTPGAGDPFEASREDLQEELQGVKRELKALTHERNVLQARVRRMEEEMGQKDKQIEELLASGAISVSVWVVCVHVCV